MGYYGKARKEVAERSGGNVGGEGNNNVRGD